VPTVHVNDVDLYYEEAGDPRGPVVLLVMGLATQLIAWPDPLIAALVDAGYRVVRYDNRDVGLSTRLDGTPALHPLWVLGASRLRMPFPLAYTLRDMAADAVALLDALGVERAHVVGASMGGMIAQHIAAGWRERVESLTTIMSSSGAPGLPPPSPALMRRLVMRWPATPSRDEAVAATIATLALISHPEAARDVEALALQATRAVDRGHYPVGGRRQLAAIIADTGRPVLLTHIVAPTLVIHGAVDPLIPLGHGEDLARRIEGAKLLIVQAMAHDLAPAALPEVTSGLLDHLAGSAPATGSPISARAVR
jgi:pimeloyl-ACP methyl ester carboxylesterase